MGTDCREPGLTLNPPADEFDFFLEEEGPYYYSSLSISVSSSLRLL